MRVNMDSSMLSDPRFVLVADDLGLDIDAVFGKCLRVWTACYERRAAELSKREADVAARQKGFADAMIQEKLADAIGSTQIAFHGIDERIQFLLAQAERGRKGGQKGKGKPKHKPSKANAKRTLKQTHAKRLSGLHATAKANTPTPDLAPDLDLDQKKEVVAGFSDDDFLIPDPPPKAKPPSGPTKGEIAEWSGRVICYLNLVTSRRFQPESDTNLEHARKAIRAGFTIEDAIAVIDAKWAEWGDDPKMARRVCPDTLFPPTKLRKYLDNDVGTGEPVRRSSEPKPGGERKLF